MTKTEPGWELYRSFLAVMREGSLSGAARALGMTQPSLGRHIRELEESLGVPLFARSPQGLSPTDLAHELAAHAQAMASASAALRRAATTRQDAIAGVVRIAASVMVGAEVLPPILAAFRQQHPGIVIELSLSNQQEDLLRRDADIAIRMARPTQEALVARHVGKIALGFFAHRQYLQANGRPKTVADLVSHALIGFDKETPFIRSMRPAGMPYARENFALRTDNDLAAVAAIRAGYGIGICQVGIARRDPALVQLLPDAFALNMDTWVVMHEDLRRSVRVHTLYDHLCDAMIDYVKQASAPRARRKP
ncbi:LysR family transcriptional regulator [Dyella mobilis]|uniref:LysR family transcriptional regulator n=1 Tax=Dyella mobilis TaxID=1849582 RepID=A0ABS2KBR1_9GAMM|nr:LysR family transcriptional regulator [Dyella mobilis]MBM7128617.1 LysR family transcriptional regulator [Dyella mobilis]GLQ99479.1 LysR family transcriptional regulator [Dyella mobilis]